MDKQPQHKHYHLFPDNPYVWIFMIIAVLVICETIGKIYK